MRRWYALLAALALLASPALGAAPVTLTLLHFNDDYQLGAVDQGKAGGLDRLATVVKRVRQTDPEAMLLFAGDLISPSVESSVFKGAQLIDGFNRLGVDAATPGNHEFDYGPQVLQQRLAESRFPWVVTNVLRRDFSRLPGTHLVLTRTVRGIPVGIFGLLTTETAIASSPGPDILFLDEVGAARAAVPLLRRRGARVVIGLTHVSMATDQAVARAVPGIAVIVGGHEHEPLRAMVDGTLIRKAGSDARYLGVIRLTVAPDGATLNVTDELIPITDQIPPDPAMAALVQQYAARLSRELDVVVARTQVPLDARNATVRARESNLGNLIADIMRAAVGADVAITNGGGIRTNALFPAGPITRRDVLAWLPFGNIVVKIRITGATLRAALENGVSQVENLSGRFPQVSGLRYTFSPGRPPGQRILEVTVDGRPLDPQATYTVATNDFMLNGGDGYSMLRDAEVLVSPASGPVMATAVIEALQRMQTVAPQVEGRIQVAP
ncbi:MAG: 5'-nucleotidase C-terminal domain-containing protein [Armatimonadota bacterium]|nr:5'-nucleotidase C-terminal domain-containing protein [Armatimonadota bacterium]MDR7403011.1 5'-nucleotidase C-terminal domain-containing protein [Armatimonadota bacterium]MDR7509866.1 5'-nucleotidase C-terminal domain-containing protein [Armatimonadota bacterium]MDR7515724.1 5'-nucleotidase C-terminal domain-containing protein [Armatimonadota bacterium]MDR7560643.1 5'-nucleotidase C-terminal domain-containing protein [Armatimonadota bacterium]